MKGNGVAREQRCRHARQRRVFGTANRNSAVKWAASRDTKFVHEAILATDVHGKKSGFYDPCNLWLTALLLAHLFVDVCAFEMHAAVSRHCFNCRSTGAEI